MRGSILSTAVVAALTGLLASACSGDEGGGNATPAATQAGTREPQLTATFTIPATNTPQPSGEAMKVFWLLDAESRDVVTLLEEYEEASYEAGFDSSAERIFVWSTPRDIEIEFDLAGNELSRTGAPGPLRAPRGGRYRWANARVVALPRPIRTGALPVAGRAGAVPRPVGPGAGRALVRI
jgi:hypothetical protein